MPLLLRNKNLPASDGVIFERLNPMTGEVVSRAAAATPADAVAAVASAAAAFPKWSAVGPSERRARLLDAAGISRSRADVFVDAMAEEIGATAGWAQFNVDACRRHAARSGRGDDADRRRGHPSDKPGNDRHRAAPAGRRGARHCALERAGHIWACGPLAMPLACGNTVMLKGSEICPADPSAHRRGLCDAGLDGGVVNVVSNAPADALEDRRDADRQSAVRRVNFTGSTRVGRIDCRGRGALFEARSARTWRQGAADRARRCRSGRGGAGRGFRRLHESGSDLHVDRAHRRR